MSIISTFTEHHSQNMEIFEASIPFKTGVVANINMLHFAGYMNKKNLIFLGKCDRLLGNLIGSSKTGV